MDVQDILIVKVQGNIYDTCVAILSYTEDGSATTHNTLQKTYIQTLRDSFATETLNKIFVNNRI
jgi:hypothetical protein